MSWNVLQGTIVSMGGGKGFLEVIKSKGLILVNYIKNQHPYEKVCVCGGGVLVISYYVRMQVSIYEAQN